MCHIICTGCIEDNIEFKSFSVISQTDPTTQMPLGSRAAQILVVPRVCNAHTRSQAIQRGKEQWRKRIQ